MGAAAASTGGARTHIHFEATNETNTLREGTQLAGLLARRDRNGPNKAIVAEHLNWARDTI